jgi:hypothetical protein
MSEIMPEAMLDIEDLNKPIDDTFGDDRIVEVLGEMTRTLKVVNTLLSRMHFTVEATRTGLVITIPDSPIQMAFQDYVEEEYRQWRIVVSEVVWTFDETGTSTFPREVRQEPYHISDFMLAAKTAVLWVCDTHLDEIVDNDEIIEI